MTDRSLRKIPQAPHPLWTGSAAGLIAGAVAGQSEKVLNGLMSRRQKRQDYRIPHAIHHPLVQQKTDSKWSTIFSWPDYPHHTIKLNVPQEDVTIGVPAFRNPEELTLSNLIKMALTAKRPGWQLPECTESQRR